MKRMKKVGLLALVLLFLTACGVADELPTEGLTGAMGVSQTSSDDMTSPETLGLGNHEIQRITSCQGEWDAENVFVHISAFELAPDQQSSAFDLNQLDLFGGSMTLLDKSSPNFQGTIGVRCVGEATVYGVPFTGQDGSQNWMAMMSIPKLRVQLPGGDTQQLENASMIGLLASSEDEIPMMLQSIYGIEFQDGYRTYWDELNGMYYSYPNASAARDMALSKGMTAPNANRYAQFYVESDESKQQQLLLDILTSDSDFLAEAVVGATVDALLAQGYTPDQVAEAFAQETNGRITVKFSDIDPNAGPYPGVMVSERGEDSVTLTISDQKNESGSETPSTGGEGGAGNGEGGTGSGEGGEGGTGSGEGGTGSGEGGEGGTDGGGSGGGEEDPGFWENLFNTLWDALNGAFEGALTGAGIGALIGGGPGAAVGAAIGAVIGAGYGALGGDGVWAGPPGENHPCGSPIFFC